ncbi:alpha/beta fold hydrolase [Cesiribacter sp. SM1]|uniref:alpha/beta fold hydrolase n=1 Tax=Cesiribacter sp. SM1 TaxID=2861196 RepID=UPI001CD6FD69|nr:alpha/beta hydrolase [Cesiribacter sp. SM1]
MRKVAQIVFYSLLFISIIFVCLGAHYYVPDIPVEALNKKYGVEPSDYIEVEGMQVHYRFEGLESDSVPVVLIHGTGSSLFTWNGWTEQLKDEQAILRFDLPGFGLTGPHPTGDYSIETYLEFLHILLKHLNIKKCVLAGNSIGGEIAWRYTLTYPEQVQQLILIDAAGYPLEIDEIPFSDLPISYMIMRVPALRELMEMMTPPEVIRGSLEFLYGDNEKVTAELVELYFDMTCREGNREALTERMESIAQPSPWEQLSSLTLPVLVIWGGQDKLIPLQHGKRFHEDLPNSSLFVLDQAGHMPMEELPQETVAEADRFLKTSLLAAPAVFPGHIGVSEGMPTR